MAKEAATVHAVVQAAVKEAQHDLSPAVWPSIAEERRRHLMAYSRIRQNRVWPLIGTATLALVALIMTGGLAEDGIVWAAMLAAVTCIAMIALTIRGAKNMPLLWDELIAVSPALRLSPIGRAYLDARLILRRLSLPPETSGELIAQLDGLLDEEARLVATRDGLGVRSVRPEEIEAEQAELQRRLAEVDDPVSREALEYGVATSERRLAAARGVALAAQRIDAQLAMIAQSIGDVRDGLHRMGMAPGETVATLDLAPIRQTLEHVQRHAAAIEGAVEEVNVLRGGP